MFRGVIKYGFLQWPWYTHISNIFYALLKGVGKKTKTKNPQGTQVPFHTWRGYKFLFHVKLLSIHAPLLLWTGCTLVIHHKVGCNWFSMELVITCSRHSSTFFQKLRLNWANMESFWFCPQWWNYWTFSAVRLFIYKFFFWHDIAFNFLLTSNQIPDPQTAWDTIWSHDGSHFLILQEFILKSKSKIMS